MLLGILTSADSDESVDAFEGVRAELYPTPPDKGEPQTPLCYAMVDDLGNLVFSGVPIGEYILIIHLPDQQVVIDNINIEHG
jgi:hypothetical protein